MKINDSYSKLAIYDKKILKLHLKFSRVVCKYEQVTAEVCFITYKICIRNLLKLNLVECGETKAYFKYEMVKCRPTSFSKLIRTMLVLISTLNVQTSVYKERFYEPQALSTQERI